MTRRSPGFSVLEIMLAIVVMVFLVGGGTAFFFSAKTSAYNTLAQAKVYAVASVAEELTGLYGGTTPTLSQLDTALHQKNGDADSNPYGGKISGGVSGPQPLCNMYNLSNTQVMDSVAWAAGWPSATGWTTINEASAGQIVYATGQNSSWFYDLTTQASYSCKGYMLGIADSHGAGPYFMRGGH